MTNYKFDLHIHTTVSDGKLYWKNLLAYAKELGLEGISITDHNTIGPVDKISNEAKKFDLKYIPGTEIKTTCKKQIEEYKLNSNSNITFLPTQEFLIYGIDHNNEEFNELSQKHLQGKRAYVIELCKSLQQHKASELPGLNIDIPLEINVENVFRRSGKYVGLSHIIEEIMTKYKQHADPDCWNKSEIKNFITETIQKQAIELMNDDPFYSLDIVEDLKKAKKWGKIVVFAHPFTKSRRNMAEFYETYLMPLLAQEGLDGIEYSYPEHGEEQLKTIKKLAQKFNLFLTGGSDFHTKGDNLGCCGVDEDTFLELEKKNQIK